MFCLKRLPQSPLNAKVASLFFSKATSLVFFVWRKTLLGRVLPVNHRPSEELSKFKVDNIRKKTF